MPDPAPLAGSAGSEPCDPTAPAGLEVPKLRRRGKDSQQDALPERVRFICGFQAFSYGFAHGLMASLVAQFG
jgi:hypothetical protein